MDKTGNRRRGRCIKEEEEYAARLIYFFNKGLLDDFAPAEGTTLRTFLSDRLRREPVQVSRKLNGVKGLGEMVYRPSKEASKAEYAAASSSLKHLEARMIARLRKTHSATVGIGSNVITASASNISSNEGGKCLLAVASPTSMGRPVHAAGQQQPSVTAPTWLCEPTLSAATLHPVSAPIQIEPRAASSRDSQLYRQQHQHTKSRTRQQHQQQPQREHVDFRGGNVREVEGTAVTSGNNPNDDRSVRVVPAAPSTAVRNVLFRAPEFIGPTSPMIPMSYGLLSSRPAPTLVAACSTNQGVSDACTSESNPQVLRTVSGTRLVQPKIIQHHLSAAATERGPGSKLSSALSLCGRLPGYGLHVRAPIFNPYEQDQLQQLQHQDISMPSLGNPLFVDTNQGMTNSSVPWRQLDTRPVGFASNGTIPDLGVSAGQASVSSNINSSPNPLQATYSCSDPLMMGTLIPCAYPDNSMHPSMGQVKYSMCQGSFVPPYLPSAGSHGYGTIQSVYPGLYRHQQQQAQDLPVNYGQWYVNTGATGLISGSLQGGGGAVLTGQGLNLFTTSPPSLGWSAVCPVGAADGGMAQMAQMPLETPQGPGQSDVWVPNLSTPPTLLTEASTTHRTQQPMPGAFSSRSASCDDLANVPSRTVTRSTSPTGSSKHDVADGRDTTGGKKVLNTRTKLASKAPSDRRVPLAAENLSVSSSGAVGDVQERQPGLSTDARTRASGDCASKSAVSRPNVVLPTDIVTSATTNSDSPVRGVVMDAPQEKPFVSGQQTQQYTSEAVPCRDQVDTINTIISASDCKPQACDGPPGDAVPCDNNKTALGVPDIIAHTCLKRKRKDTHDIPADKSMNANTALIPQGKKLKDEHGVNFAAGKAAEGAEQEYCNNGQQTAHSRLEETRKNSAIVPDTPGGMIPTASPGQGNAGTPSSDLGNPGTASIAVSLGLLAGTRRKIPDVPPQDIQEQLGACVPGLGGSVPLEESVERLNDSPTQTRASTALSQGEWTKEDLASSATGSLTDALTGSSSSDMDTSVGPLRYGSDSLNGLTSHPQDTGAKRRTADEVDLQQ